MTAEEIRSGREMRSKARGEEFASKHKGYFIVLGRKVRHVSMIQIR